MQREGRLGKLLRAGLVPALFLSGANYCSHGNLTIAVMSANDCSHVIQNTSRTKEEQVISLSLSLVIALTSKPFGLWQS